MVISFEGIDGTGKTTQLKFVEAWLEAQGISYIALREPGGTKLGEACRTLLKDPAYGPLDPPTEVFLLSASRHELLRRQVRPALEQGQWVLLDRYVDSTLAYQAYGRGLGLEQIAATNELATGGFLPDVTFLLDLDPEQAAARIERRSGEARTRSEGAEGADAQGETQAVENAQGDRMEAAGIAFMRRVRDGYLELAAREPDRFVVIDADSDPETMQETIQKVLKERRK